VVVSLSRGDAQSAYVNVQKYHTDCLRAERGYFGPGIRVTTR
jgi:hypothetical protein